VYVHLGGELIVRAPDVVAVLDARLLESSEINREFVARAQKAQRLKGNGLTPDCKALVVTQTAVITSGVSPPTLARRLTRLRQSAAAWERER
jgi:regulator of extracellular matrix RemA (YlzA/DUF370 family)